MTCLSWGKCTSRQSVITSRLQCSESVGNLTITIIDTVYKVTVNSIRVYQCHFDKHRELMG